MNDIANFIRQQRSAGIPDEQIRTSLKTTGGWTEAEVSQAFDEVALNLRPRSQFYFLQNSIFGAVLGAVTAWMVVANFDVIQSSLTLLSGADSLGTQSVHSPVLNPLGIVYFFLYFWQSWQLAAIGAIGMLIGAIAGWFKKVHYLFGLLVIYLIVVSGFSFAAQNSQNKTLKQSFEKATTRLEVKNCTDRALSDKVVVECSLEARQDIKDFYIYAFPDQQGATPEVISASFPYPGDSTYHDTKTGDGVPRIGQISYQEKTSVFFDSNLVHYEQASSWKMPSEIPAGNHTVRYEIPASSLFYVPSKANGYMIKPGVRGSSADFNDFPQKFVIFRFQIGVGKDVAAVYYDYRTSRPYSKDDLK